MSHLAPPASLDEKPINVTSKLCLFFYLSMVSDIVHKLKLEAQLVNSYGFSTGIILETASHKSLREKQATHPESIGCSFLNPALQKCNSLA